MDTQKYWKERVEQLTWELDDKRMQLRAVSVDSEWNHFLPKADRQLRSAYSNFCDTVRRRVLLKLRFGAHSLMGAGNLHSVLKQQGCFRLIAYAGESATGSTVMVFPENDNRWGYAGTRLRLRGRRTGEASLSFDFQGTRSATTCFGEGVKSWRELEYTQYDTGNTWPIEELIDAAMAEANERLAELVLQFESLAAEQMREERLRQQVKTLEGSLASASRGARIWANVQLPEEQFLDIADQLKLFAETGTTSGGLLLKGSPGTGKTMLAKKIAEASGASFFEANVGSLKGENIGSGAAASKELWKKIRFSKPALLFIDECDAVFAKRGSRNSDSGSGEVINTFLAEWDGKESGIWVIGSTNRRDLLDDAILSRFAREIELRLPDGPARRKILQQECLECGYRGGLPANIEALTQGMSGRDLALLARQASGKTEDCDWSLIIRRFRGAASPNVDASASWDTLVLSDAVKARLKTTCSLLSDAESWKKIGISAPAGILLEGPPGTGKTEIARTLANESGLGFVKASGAELVGMWQGDGGANVRDVFEKARAVAPAILFIDEIDIVAPKRSERGTQSMTREVIGQMLQEMDGVTKSQNHVFVLAATNCTENIDSAILSRFTEHIHIPLPDAQGRKQILQILLFKAKTAFSEAEMEQLATLAHGKSGRDLKNWVQMAQQSAVARAIAEGGSSAYALRLEDMVASFSSKAEALGF